MAIFSAKNEGKWFYFDPSNESGGGVCLRSLTPEKLEEIQGKVLLEVKQTMIQGQYAEVKKVNEVWETNLIQDYCIVAWKNVQHENANGKIEDVKCDDRGRRRMMKTVDFRKFVNKHLLELTQENKAIEEARAKNLGTTSPGSLPKAAVKTVPKSTDK